jgi:hypothetical protein
VRGTLKPTVKKSSNKIASSLPGSEIVSSLGAREPPSVKFMIDHFQNTTGSYRRRPKIIKVGTGAFVGVTFCHGCESSRHLHAPTRFSQLNQHYHNLHQQLPSLRHHLHPPLQGHCHADERCSSHEPLQFLKTMNEATFKKTRKSTKRKKAGE